MRSEARIIAIAGAGVLLLGGPVLAARSGPVPQVPKQPAECCAATGADVPKVGGDYGDQDFSSLTRITVRNVHRLAGAWLDHLGGARTQESTPVVAGGDLYLQTKAGDIFSVDGATGRVLWKYKSAHLGVERSVAVGAGRVFSALPDRRVIALDQKTGRLIWETQVGTPGQDTAKDSGTPWTLYYHGLVFAGTENGGGAGLRGHLYALHASSGKLAWSFAATAGPGQPGHRSWKGRSWRLGGGDAWMAPAIDPQLGLVYLALANPQPRTAAASRAGDDFYTNSLVALHWDTGKLAWWFQSVHHDLWDYDDTMSPVIADIAFRSGIRKVVIYGSKSAWLYYLDASTGKPVLPVHEVKVPQLAAQATSPTQPIPQGDPLVPTCPKAGTPSRPIPDYVSGCEFTPYLHGAVVVAPGGDGGADWALMSFDQRNGLLYVAASLADYGYTDGLPFGQPTVWRPEGELTGGAVDAVSPATNKIVWQAPARYPLSLGDGILSTASGLLFEGTPNGLLDARSAENGKMIWSWQTGAGIKSTPVTYSVNRVQYVAVLTGGLPGGKASLWALKLGGKIPPATAPPPIPSRVPVIGPTVPGRATGDVVVLGRTWDAATGSPSPTENLASQVAMAPPIMTVPARTTVTFKNPAGNTRKHCAEAFFDPANFQIGPLAPGHSGSFRFVRKGTYFYNDCAGFPWDTGEIIVS
jgi:PQQ-dependent dehydrogenase (methanol/ethanol family)